MRDQFVGDIGDFGKYGLLRCLTGQRAGDADLTLGVVWYYRRDEPGNDGKFIDYLCLNAENQRIYRACDPDLWDELRRLVKSGNRFVRCVEQAPILPAGTQYFRDLLSFDGVPSGKQRQQHRSDWLQRALQATEGADIVFLDPDNNIPPHEINKYRKDGPKYAYLDEIKAFWERGQSVVIYHHTNLSKSVDEQIRETAKWLECKLGIKPMALRWTGFQTRAFFVIPQPEYQTDIGARINQLLNSPWGWSGLFNRVNREERE